MADQSEDEAVRYHDYGKQEADRVEDARAEYGERGRDTSEPRPDHVDEKFYMGN